MMIKTIVALAMLAAPIAAQAEGVPLALGLTSGMSKAEVKAIVPKQSIVLGQGCHANFEPIWEDGKLVGLRISNSYQDRGSNTDCGAMVMSNLRAKYGEPKPMNADRDCEFFRGACSAASLSGILSPRPLANVLRRAENGSENEYLGFESQGVSIRTRQSKQYGSVIVIYRELPQATVDADVQAKL